MDIKIRQNGLVFRGLNREQEIDVEMLCGDTIVLSDVNGELYARGDKEELFDLLYGLSTKYDIELN